MSNGYFFAYASAAGARQSRPTWFEQDENGDWQLKSPRVLRSTSGVWLTMPAGYYSGVGIDQTFVETSPGVMSAPYVVLSPENDGPAGKLITPQGEGGFA